MLVVRVKRRSPAPKAVCADLEELPPSRVGEPMKALAVLGLDHASGRPVATHQDGETATVEPFDALELDLSILGRRGSSLGRPWERS